MYEKKDIQKKLLDALEIKWIYSDLIKSAYPEKYKEIKSQSTKQKIAEIIWNKKRGIIIDDDKLLNYSLCPECNPIYPNKIIAKTGRTGIKIHDIKCKALKTVHPENLLEAHWEWENTENYSVITTILADKDINVIKFLEVFMKINIEINSFSVKSDISENKKIIKVTRWINNPSQSTMIRNEIKKFGNSIKVINREFE
jgi:(p)ppGpp synthase/HD superfamily hydrolase